MKRFWQDCYQPAIYSSVELEQIGLPSPIRTNAIGPAGHTFIAQIFPKIREVISHASRVCDAFCLAEHQNASQCKSFYIQLSVFAVSS